MTFYDAWAEIDLSAFSYNINQFKRILQPSSRLMAVLKADAYGHGLLEVAGRVLTQGAEVLGVARISEAIRIREAGIDAPILVFGFTPPDLAGKLIDYDLTQSIWSYEMARLLSEAVGRGSRKIIAHLKVDTGMGRLGLLPCDLGRHAGDIEISDSAIRDAETIKGLPGIDLEGVYTHFATADAADKTAAKRQFEVFNRFLAKLKKQGIEFQIRHAANSAAIIDMPETHMDMVRLGISLYGYYPSEFVDTDKVRLRPVMTLKTRIIHLKKVSPGFCVSYGATWRASNPTIIATVSLGYGDGYSRLLSSRSSMMVRGRLAPVVGRVCMDQTMLDVGGIPDVSVGDEVVAFGPHKELPIGADHIAQTINTISYEVLTGISRRVPRVFIR